MDTVNHLGNRALVLKQFQLSRTLIWEQFLLNVARTVNAIERDLSSVVFKCATDNVSNRPLK